MVEHQLVFITFILYSLHSTHTYLYHIHTALVMLHAVATAETQVDVLLQVFA